jgi:hypothetical protein
MAEGAGDTVKPAEPTGFGVPDGDIDRVGVVVEAGRRAVADGVDVGLGNVEDCTAAGALPTLVVAGGRTST